MTTRQFTKQAYPALLCREGKRTRLIVFIVDPELSDDEDGVCYDAIPFDTMLGAAKYIHADCKLAPLPKELGVAPLYVPLPQAMYAWMESLVNTLPVSPDVEKCLDGSLEEAIEEADI